MSHTPDLDADPLVIEARKRVAQSLRAINYSGEYNVAEAIEALIEAKIAVTLEALSDRIENKTGVRP